MHIRYFIKCINGHERPSGIKFGHEGSEYRVHTLFWAKNSRSFQGHISNFFKDSVQCKKEPWVCLFWFFLFYPEGLPVLAPFRHLRMVHGNPGNSQNSSWNLVCTCFKHETEGGRTFSVWAAGLWKTIPISLKKNECVHSFKKASS